MSECECQLENDYLTLCEGHKLELENLKNNPPLWAIRARRGEKYTEGLDLYRLLDDTTSEELANV